MKVRRSPETTKHSLYDGVPDRSSSDSQGLDLISQLEATTSYAHDTEQEHPSILKPLPDPTAEQRPAMELRRIRFCDTQKHRPETYYRQQRTFSRNSDTSYRPGRWADTSGEGFVDTSGHNDPDRHWTTAVKGEFPWTHDQTPEFRRDIDRLREATCGATGEDVSLEDEAQAEALDYIKVHDCESALERALILRQELVGTEQTQAEWYECCDNVLRPRILPRKVFSGKLHPSAHQRNRERSKREVG